MHAAVAPACNIQCNYCNRKYDCANESRPGVVSELVSPMQAAQKAEAVAKEIPQLSVFGIAGPGDPLANPKRTFATFRLVAERLPALKLCLSTNGLNLPGWVDTLRSYRVDHVTITINCIDPAIGAKIYPWIIWQRQRMYGEAAVANLIRQQLLGLDRLVAADILVKVNSVMIPGINDEHLVEVSRTIKQKGAFLHNILPLIAKPEHGTYFGLNGQRQPSPQELHALREQCGANMSMMRHCQQCRADAIGLLKEDRSQEFTMVKIGASPCDAPAKSPVQARLAVSV